MAAPYRLYARQKRLADDYAAVVSSGERLLKFVRGNEDYKYANWSKNLTVWTRSLIENQSYERSTHATKVRLLSVRQLQSHGQPHIDGLPRTLASDGDENPVSVPPRGMQGFKLFEGSWNDGVVSLILAPGSRGDPLPILGPGHYVLRVVTFATDVLPVTEEYIVDTRGGAYSCEFYRP